MLTDTEVGFAGTDGTYLRLITYWRHWAHTAAH